MSAPDDLADRAARAIQQAIMQHHGIVGRALDGLEPLEALCLLGSLVSRTIERFPPNQRSQMVEAFCAELQQPH